MGIQAHDRRQSPGQRWRHAVRTGLWRMDIHPSAWIAPSALIDRTWPRGVHIGAGCIVEEEAVLLVHDRIHDVHLDTRVGDGTVVGARAIVMPGVTIGRDCRILPGAVVVADVSDGATVAGNPARAIGPVPDPAA